MRQLLKLLPKEQQLLLGAKLAKRDENSFSISFEIICDGFCNIAFSYEIICS